MLRDELIYDLFEDIATNNNTLIQGEAQIEELTDLTIDEADCLRELLLDWFKC